MPADLISKLKAFVRSEIRTVQTVTYVRVEEIDDDRRATVSLKRDSDLLIDNVPVASTWARDGAGVIVPVERGDEGFVLHPKEPLEKQIQQRGEQDPGSDRRFELEDAVFFPELWTDEDDVPEHESGEFLVDLGEDAPELRMNLETGGFQVVDGSGHGIVSDGEGNFTWHAQSVDVKEGPID